MEYKDRTGAVQQNIVMQFAAFGPAPLVHQTGYL